MLVNRCGLAVLTGFPPHPTLNADSSCRFEKIYKSGYLKDYHDIFKKYFISNGSFLMLKFLIDFEIL